MAHNLTHDEAERAAWLAGRADECARLARIDELRDELRAVECDVDDERAEAGFKLERCGRIADRHERALHRALVMLEAARGVDRPVSLAEAAALAIIDEVRNELEDYDWTLERGEQ